MAATALYARSNNGSTATDTLIPGSLVRRPAPIPHRLERVAGRLRIDGVQVASHAVAIGAMMRPVASDYDGEGDALRIDWMRMTPYAAAATFSPVCSTLGVATWTAATITGATPAGTAVMLSVSYGNSPVPDASWTAFTPVTGAIDVISRYLQVPAAVDDERERADASRQRRDNRPRALSGRGPAAFAPPALRRASPYLACGKRQRRRESTALHWNKRASSPRGRPFCLLMQLSGSR